MYILYSVRFDQTPSNETKDISVADKDESDSYGDLRNSDSGLKDEIFTVVISSEDVIFAFKTVQQLFPVSGLDSSTGSRNKAQFVEPEFIS